MRSLYLVILLLALGACGSHAKGAGAAAPGGAAVVETASNTAGAPAMRAGTAPGTSASTVVPAGSDASGASGVPPDVCMEAGASGPKETLLWKRGAALGGDSAALCY